MKYMGSKERFAKYLLPFILKDRQINQYYVEPFVGGCNMIDKVNGNRIGNDNNRYLIAMWREIQNGWIPPKSISRDEYNVARTAYNENSCILPDYLIGYIGFNGSYGGRFFDGGYAGLSATKIGSIRNYPLEAYNNISKQFYKVKDITFYDNNYWELNIPQNSIIYCDPPYNGTKKYSTSFDSNHFWTWCRQQKNKGHQVFISEYNAPDDFKCLIQLNAKSSLSANGMIGANKNSVEKLFTI